jgi:glycosyltransferase involved in cell wall biosynthesis
MSLASPSIHPSAAIDGPGWHEPAALVSEVAFLISDFGDGGVERMLVNTSNALSEIGIRTSLLVPKRELPFLGGLRREVSLVPLGNEEGPALVRLRRFLIEDRPRIVITAKLKDDALAVRARSLSDTETRLFFRVGNPLGFRLEMRTLNPLRRWWTLRKLRMLYSSADGYIAVSAGIAEDLVETLRVPADKVCVLPNPTITPALFSLAEQPPEHPWFIDGGSAPIILGIGGLRHQKNFGALVQAFAQVRAERPCRLLILGEGRQRPRLLQLADELGVGRDVSLPGWQSNPFGYLARAAVFVLSSLWEGSPNALVEAAALGVPVVAFDCVSGPRDILGNGRYGELVPVGNVAALARGIRKSLDRPRSSELTRRAALPYTMRASAEAYARALRLNAGSA